MSELTGQRAKNTPDCETAAAFSVDEKEYGWTRGREKAQVGAQWLKVENWTGV